MQSTPQKTDLNTSTLTPVRFVSSPAQSQKDPQGIRSRLEKIVDVLIKNQEKWNAAQNRGLSLCRSIEAVKTKALETEGGGKYPQTLEPYCSKLKVILSIFEDVLASAKTSMKQIKALASLCKYSEDVIFRTWSIRHFVEFVADLVSAYEQEFGIKSIVVEEIAHAKTRPELVLHTSVWEYPAYTDDTFLLKFSFFTVDTQSQNK